MIKHCSFRHPRGTAATSKSCARPGLLHVCCYVLPQRMPRRCRLYTSRFLITALILRIQSPTTQVQALTDSPEGIELFGKGQRFYKEVVSNAADAGGLQQRHLHPSVALAAVGAVAHAGKPGGNPKYLHQDSA